MRSPTAARSRRAVGIRRADRLRIGHDPTCSSCRPAVGRRTPRRTPNIPRSCRAGSGPMSGHPGPTTDAPPSPVGHRPPDGVAGAGGPPRGSTGNPVRPTATSATAKRTDRGPSDRRPTNPSPAVPATSRNGCRRRRLATTSPTTTGSSGAAGPDRPARGHTGPDGFGGNEGRLVPGPDQLPAGDSCRSPTSRYEVATGVRTGRGGAPEPILTAAGPGRSAAASRQSASIARAVASGCSICGTWPQPASTSKRASG